MAIVLGVNAGFVSAAPISDPQGAFSLTIDNNKKSQKDTTESSGETNVLEIGWWMESASATGTMTYRVAIYEHDSDNDKPGALLHSSGDVEATISAGNWFKINGLSFAIDSDTTYWIAVGVDGIFNAININQHFNGGRSSEVNGNPALTDPWGASDEENRPYAIYALVGEPSAGTNMQINVGDVWKEVPSIQINIGDSWKEVVGIQQNIGDTWKEVF